MDETPSNLLCYVELENNPGNLTLAFHRDGEFLSRKFKPYSGQIARWYSLEKADGSPLF
jgi:hypothetical protein